VSIERKIKQRKERRKLRVRKRISKSIPRLSIFRSLKHIYAQLIVDMQQKTLASCSSLELKNLKGDKKEIAKAIGLKLADKLKELGITRAILDRGCFLYHGRVKALAEGLREGGIQI